MGVNEAVRSVFGRAAEDDEFRELLFADPASAGRGVGLTGADLHELVGTIAHANRGQEARRRHLIIIRDFVAQKHDGKWPFEALGDEELIERAAVAEVYAHHLYECIGMGIDAPVFVDDVERWAKALEGEVTRRVETPATESHTALALALIHAKQPQEAARRSKNR